ncbi:MAG: ABC transporter ATP-binding protein [Rhodospirillales bacterium]|nr:ABC transporter ATP-binding protein [Rhodospirillales bacterium]
MSRSDASLKDPGTSDARLGLGKTRFWPTMLAGIGMLTPRERRKAILLAIAIAVADLVQLFSIIAVLPIVGIIVQPDMMEKSTGTVWLYEMSGADSRQAFLFMLAGSAFVALLVGHLGALAVNIVLERFVARLNVRLSHDLVTELVNAPFSWFLHQSAAALTRMAHDDVTFWSRDMIGNGLRILSLLTTVVSTTIMVVFITPLGGLAMLAVAGALAAVATRIIKVPMVRWNRIAREASERSMVMTTQILSGIKDVKANCTQEHFTDLFTEATRHTRSASARATILGMIPAPLIILIVQAGMLLVMMGMWWSGVQGGAMAAQMALIVLAAARITPAVIRLQTSVTSLIKTETWVAGLIGILADARAARAVETAPKTLVPVPVWEMLRFEDVSFAYEGAERAALHDINIEIPRGACIGIKGASGAGKSTFIDVLLGLLTPDSGKVLVGNVAVSEIGQDWLHHVGYVPQQPFFTDDTLGTNIAFGLPLDPEKMARIADHAGLSEFAAVLPQGFDTPLGDRGQRASGGQRQRIAIARALYREPTLLVLDEATAALDAETEAALVETLRDLRGAITMVIVSHREAPMVLCDSVVTLEYGRRVDDTVAEATTRLAQ